VDLAVEACTRLKLPLKVFGKEFAGYGEELRKLAGPTVEFIGEVSDEVKLDLMARAKAFIFPSNSEDFGITPVEAMSVGTPVIAYRSGGVVESVVAGKTGLFFDQPTAESLTKAIKQFGKIKIFPQDCFRQAQKFSLPRFKKEMLQFINACLAEKKKKI
jgi:glycosyltransferase involved in cell wall biosynthesis